MKTQWGHWQVGDVASLLSCTLGAKPPEEGGPKKEERQEIKVFLVFCGFMSTFITHIACILTVLLLDHTLQIVIDFLAMSRRYLGITVQSE